MATYSHSIGGQTWRFDSLREVLAKASPLRSGDCLAGVAAASDAEPAAAQMTLADVPLKQFLLEAVIPYERDEVTRLIIDTHDASAFAAVSHLTVGDFRDWLLGYEVDSRTLAALAPGARLERLGEGRLRRLELPRLVVRVPGEGAAPPAGGGALPRDRLQVEQVGGF